MNYQELTKKELVTILREDHGISLSTRALKDDLIKALEHEIAEETAAKATSDSTPLAFFVALAVVGGLAIFFGV